MGVCTNCGKPFTYERRDTFSYDRRDIFTYAILPWAEDGTNGCVWVKNARHPCGGVYDISDYHRAGSAP